MCPQEHPDEMDKVDNCHNNSTPEPMGPQVFGQPRLVITVSRSNIGGCKSGKSCVMTRVGAFVLDL